MSPGAPTQDAPAPRAFRTIGVVGLGTMGAGIAETFARHGFAVVGVEVDYVALERGRQHLQRSTDRAVTRTKLSGADQEALLGRVTLTTDLVALADCDLVVEAIVERMAVKQALVRRLDEVVGERAMIATNTSSLSVTELSTASSRPGRVVGLHFFNPAPVQRLVEVVRTVVSDPDVVEDVRRLVGGLGKTPVVCGDRAGFIANTLLFGYLNRAVQMYETGHASREDIDTAMRVGCGYPMGPLELLDLIGLDTAYQILQTMYRQSRDRRHAPAPVLGHLVTAGLLGRKSGRGFYTYEAPGSGRTVADDRTPPARAESSIGRATGTVATVAVLGAGATPDARSAGLVEALRRAGFQTAYVGAGQLDDRLDDQHDLREADLVLEAVEDHLEAKTAVFAALDKVCRPGAVLATTTAYLPVVALGAATARAHDVVGLHPVALGTPGGAALVEVVATVVSDPVSVETARSVGSALGTVVSCADRAGFIVHALLVPYLNDAVALLEEHYASADDVDTAMVQGCALPVGPIAQLDAMGTDVALRIARAIYRESREPGLAPRLLLDHLVTAGHLGRGTGRGLRDYSRG